MISAQESGRLIAKITLVVLCVAINHGCMVIGIVGATAAGSAIGGHVEMKKREQQHLCKVERKNTERAKAGLEPLDLCTEKYKFDRPWAIEDEACAERVKRYEAGDHSALKGDPTPPTDLITGLEARRNFKFRFGELQRAVEHEELMLYRKQLNSNEPRSMLSEREVAARFERKR